MIPIDCMYVKNLFTYECCDLGSDTGRTDGIASTHMARGVALRGRVRAQCGADYLRLRVATFSGGSG